jgi:hypothetical protein
MGDIHGPNFNKLHLLPAGKLYSGGTAAYLVNPSSVQKLTKLLMEKTVPEIKDPLDIALRNLCQEKLLSGFVAFPYICGLTVESNCAFIGSIPQKDLSEAYSNLTNVFVSNQDLRHLGNNHRSSTRKDAACIADLYKANFERILAVRDVDPQLQTALFARRQTHKLENPKHYKATQSMRSAQSSSGYTFKSFDDTKSIFIHVPKCAGVSVVKSLYSNLAGGHTTLYDYTNIFEPSALLTYFKFTFVRNPFHRLLSAYLFLQQGGMNKFDKAWYEKELSRYENFNDFVCNWLTPENIWKYIHFKPQYHFVRDPTGLIEVDYVGRFERLQEDFGHICAKLGCNRKLPKSNSAFYSELTDYYNDKTREIVSQIYAQDFEEFGYSIEGVE